MTDYVLEVRSFAGIVPGARHFKGMVKGPRPEPCHGGTITHHGASGPLQGKTTCGAGHVMPEKTEWEVEATWDEARYDRYAAAHFEGDGPGQFTDERKLFEAARARFLGETGERGWWEPRHVPGEPGDRLYYQCLPGAVLLLEEEKDEYWLGVDRQRRAGGLPVHGDLIAEVPQAEDGPRFYVTAVRSAARAATGEQVTGRLLGPYRTRAEAEGLVDDARRLAVRHDPATEFDAFAVSKVARPVRSGEWAPGLLNIRLEAERAASAS